MSQWENDIELIEAYLRELLPEKDIQAFEKRLAEDAEFAKQFKELKLMKQGARLSKLDKVFESLQQTETALPAIERTKLSKVRPLWMKITAAASIILLIGFAYFLLKPSSLSPGQLFAESFEPYPNNVIKRSQQGSHSDLKISAYQAYDQRAYEESITRFQELFEAEADSSLLYLGNACLATGQTDLAIENFLLYLPNAGIFANQTKWYLNLAYLKKGEIEKAKSLLEELAEGTHSYASKAKATLKKL